MKKILSLLILISICITLISCSGEKEADYEDFNDTYTDKLPDNAEDGLTLHAFNWTYEQVRTNLKDIADAGFKNVLLMPVQQPKSNGSAWWAFYQPLSFSIGDKSPLGSKEELIRLCDEAEEYGICILADLVLNHMANDGDKAVEPDGTPMVSPEVLEYEPLLYNNRNVDVDGIGVTFHHNPNASGTGAETQVYQWGNLPDLNTANPYVQERVLYLMKECIDAGIDGFRFDAAKHVETNSDQDYASDFWNNTLEVAKEYYHEKTGKNLYVYGEILATPLSRPLSYYTSMMRITDDGFVASFRNFVAQKKPELILNASLKVDNTEDLIAWVESHDEYISGSTHYSEGRIAKYWSVIAVKKGLGGLYLSRPVDDLAVGKIGSLAFENENVAAVNRFHNRFYAADTYESVSGLCYVNEKILPDDQGALVIYTGEVNPDEKIKVELPHLENGNYYDALSGRKVVVTDGVANIIFDDNGVAVLTRSNSIRPQLDVSDTSEFFVNDKEITVSVKNAEEAYYYFNDGKDAKVAIDGSASFNLKEHLEDSQAVLHVYARNGSNVIDRAYTYKTVEVSGNMFNVLNLDEKYLNGDYEIYIWSWSPGRWSKDYEIKDGVMYVDTTGMDGFLIGIFEKGYVIENPDAWDDHVIKQSADFSGAILKQGFADMEGF
ncbi:MAG: hypothetical protein IJJ00_05565 [Erysipelotrichaceae bacterium]|nr:hypothetical protein [Erysipelotrichaceae bacterium]